MGVCHDVPWQHDSREAGEFRSPREIASMHDFRIRGATGAGIHVPVDFAGERGGARTSLPRGRKY